MRFLCIVVFLMLTRPLTSFTPRLVSRLYPLQSLISSSSAQTDAPPLRPAFTQSRLFSQRPPSDMSQEEIDRAREERKAVSENQSHNQKQSLLRLTTANKHHKTHVTHITSGEGGRQARQGRQEGHGGRGRQARGPRDSGQERRQVHRF